MERGPRGALVLRAVPRALQAPRGSAPSPGVFSAPCAGLRARRWPSCRGGEARLEEGAISGFLSSCRPASRRARSARVRPRARGGQTVPPAGRGRRPGCARLREEGKRGLPSAPRRCFLWGRVPWCSAPPGQLCSDEAPVPARPGGLCPAPQRPEPGGGSLLPALGQIPANRRSGQSVWKLQEAPEEGMWCKGEKRRRGAGKLLCGTSPSPGTATAQAEVSSPLTRALAAEQRSPRRGGAGGAAKGHAGSAAGGKGASVGGLGLGGLSLHTPVLG